MNNVTNQGCAVYIGRIIDYEKTVMLPKSILQSQYALRLMKYAYYEYFGKEIDGQNLRKTKSGKWVCDCGHISVSHSGNYVAVALSRGPVGVDLQILTATQQRDTQSLAKKFFNQKEMQLFESQKDQTDAFFFTWCKKEALWKMLEPQPYTIKDADTTTAEFCTKKLPLDGETYYLAVTDPKTEIVFECDVTK